MSDGTTKRPLLSYLAIIGLLAGILLFLAVLFRADIYEYFSRLPDGISGFCAVATLVILPTYALGALVVLVISDFQKKKGDKFKR